MPTTPSLKVYEGLVYMDFSKTLMETQRHGNRKICQGLIQLFQFRPLVSISTHSYAYTCTCMYVHSCICTCTYVYTQRERGGEGVGGGGGGGAEVCTCTCTCTISYIHSHTIGNYEVLPSSNLPPIWLAYLSDPSDSGKIHSNVKQRWIQREWSVACVHTSTDNCRCTCFEW